MFDSANVVNWAKKLKMRLMRTIRSHLLEAPPVRPPNNPAAAVRAEYKKDIKEWLERKDTCVSAIYETAQHVPNALEIVEVCTGIDRLNGIVQKLTQHSLPPTPEARLAKLNQALQIPSLEQLWLTISLCEDPTYDEVVSTCKNV